MDQKRVLVTGIGGNVGQGILRNIKASGYNIFLVGCNTTAFSPGNHLCDDFAQTPYAYDKEYIPAICKIVEDKKIDLIIPSTDYEVYYLALNRSKIKCTIAVSGIKASELYLDKFKTFLHHKKCQIPFAESILPSLYKKQFKDCIAKPREGRGSRGLAINPADFTGYDDDKYMIQELHRGQEITTAFYVTRQKKLLGQITMTRSLENGTTTACSVNSTYDKKIIPILEKIVAHSDIAGAANLQSIVGADGNIYPFEINCRISGTNSIRSNFGFKDVTYTLQEYLYDQEPENPIIIKGTALRILMDVIYPLQDNPEELLTNKAQSYIF